MPQGMTTATEILKEVFIGRINNQLDNEPTTYNRIKTKTNAEKYGGKWVEFPIHIQRNTGIGARTENAALPTAGQQGYREAQIKVKSFYGAFELTGQTFDLAEKDYQAFSSLVSEESNRIKDDLMVDRNRQVYGNGTGVMATTASLASQVITLSTTGDRGVWRLQDGMKIDVMIGNTAVVRQGGLTVSDIDITANTITVVGTTTGIVAGDVIVRQGNYGNEWTGLNAIIDDASALYGIAHTNGPTGSRHWRAHVNTQSGTPTEISEATMARMSDRIKFSGGKTTCIYAAPGVYRKYWQLLKSDRRFVNTQEFKGGYKGITYDSPQGEVPFLNDDQASTGTMYFVNENELDIFRPYEYKLIDRGGSTWKQKSDANGTYDVWQAWLVEHSEIGTKRRNTHGKITNIIEDAY
jgi:hypothetical protein